MCRRAALIPRHATADIAPIPLAIEQLLRCACRILVVLWSAALAAQETSKLVSEEEDAYSDAPN